jgi:Tfp pilus assembly protein PilW
VKKHSKYQGGFMPRSATAFTLVELLVGMTLSLMVMTAVLSSYVFLGKNFTRTLGISSANQPTLESQGRRAVAYFTRDVQMASGRTGTVSASEVTLVLPTSSGTKNVTYYLNLTASPVSVYSVTVPANALARIDRSTSTSLTLMTNLLSTTAAPSSFKYSDAAGNPYTTYVNYLPGIKQIYFSLSAQAGSSTNGTLTQVYQISSAPLLLRNTPLLY